MAELFEVMPLVQLPPGKGTTVTVAGRDVALFNVDGTIYAMEDSCLHQGLSLGTSKLDNNIVTCRGHGWRYNVSTGKVLHVPDYGLTSYPVKVVDGKIMLTLDPSPGAHSEAE